MLYATSVIKAPVLSLPWPGNDSGEVSRSYHWLREPMQWEGRIRTCIQHKTCGSDDTLGRPLMRAAEKRMTTPLNLDYSNWQTSLSSVTYVYLIYTPKQLRVKGPAVAAWDLN